MSDNQNATPTQTEWRNLYELAARVKELTPWEWMFEDEVFGVKDPETGATGFVSIMGHAGEHFAVALYPDAEALYAFLDLHDQGMEDEDEEGDPLAMMRVLEIPQLQLSFEDTKQLDKEDKTVIKQLGLKFRSARSWPQFRSYAPGLLPWYITSAEARRLATALEQLLAVAPRCRENEELLAPSEDGMVFLVRAQHEENGAQGWEDQIQTIDEPEPQPFSVGLDEDVYKQAKELRRANNVLELEVMMLPMPVQEKKNERGYFPYLLLLAESQSGALLGNEMLQPLPTLLEMYCQLPQILLEKFVELGGLLNLRMRNPLAAQILAPLAEDFGLTLEVTDELPAIDQAMEFMGQMMPMF
ncbi:MAG: hypothetical protein HYR56_30970 [Acidobacteria bacterium]|nr:hypothetical protein [Acidobacteriota bacterium]MBI3424789.1 hypothetical protein [Acidobacteriota bacterium]